MKDEKAAGSDRAKDARQDRLKLALRENLKRRRSQARGRGAAARVSSDDAANDDALSSRDVRNKPSE
jgi:hypothetical protein